MAYVCPRCGRELRIANQEHVCSLYDLESHFTGRDPIGRQVFDWICESLDPLGRYDVLPMKTMIAFANGVNFAFLKTKKRGAEFWLVLAESPKSTRFELVTVYSRTKSIYRTSVRDRSELDDDLIACLGRAHSVTVP